MGIALVIMAVVVAADQLTKLWIVCTFAPHEILVVIPGFFNLTHLTNTGAAFGMLAGEPSMARQVFFIGIAVVALVLMALALRQYGGRHRLFAVAIGLVAGGAIGNLIDRLRLGAVIDFLDFYIGRHHWPAFNVADSAITIGVGCFLLAEYLAKDEKRQAQRK